jgi:hypothetical protein
MTKQSLQRLEATPGVHAAPEVDLACRMPQFVGLEERPGPRLRRLKAAVVGAGSVGARIALHLARQQIAQLAVIDRSRFKTESLLTQPILPAAIGRWKAEHVGQLCQLISPRTDIFIHAGRFEELETFALEGFDLVFLATDNLGVEVQVGQSCRHLGKPLIHASVHGETLVAQVRVFRNERDDDPCPACAFGMEEWRALHAETAFRCELTEGGEPVREDRSAPTVSVSFLCSLAADLAVTQMFRFVLGLGQPVANTIIEHAGFTSRSVVAPLKVNHECPVDHQVWKPMSGPVCLESCSLSQLAETTNIHDPAILVDDLEFVQSAFCACGSRFKVDRFVTPGQRLGRCPSCIGRLQADPFATYRSVTRKQARSIWCRPLGEVGAAGVCWIVLRNDARAVRAGAGAGRNCRQTRLNAVDNLRK